MIGDLMNMKKILPICIIGMLLLGGISSVARTDTQSEQGNRIYESCEFSPPVLTDEGAYLRVSVAEALSSLRDAEKPQLPVFIKVFTFPFGTTITDVSVRYSGIETQRISKPILPAAAQVPMSTDLLSQPLDMDPLIYGDVALYPSQSASYSLGAGLQGTEHVVFLVVRCYPVRYSPAQNILSVSGSVEIEISYEEPTAPLLSSQEYQMVIIAPARFSDALGPLIEHKNSKGVASILKTTEDIYAEYTGFDEAEKIKYFINDALEEWGVSFVLLVGGVKQVPIRTTWFYQRHHEHYWNETVLTDLYYSDIYDAAGDFCSWDTNANGLYGEVFDNCPGIDDVCDLYPDVHIGRLACVKNTEVKTVVSKIIQYETQTAGESWYQNIILIGGDTFPGWNGNEGELLNVMIEQIMSNFTSTRLWTSDGTFTTQSLNKAINQGAGFIDYSGHGFEIGLGTHPPDSETWVTYHTNNLLGAFNSKKLPIVFFDACLTAKLDFNISDLMGYVSEELASVLEKVPRLADLRLPTFAWSMVKKRNGGAIATVGATRTAFGGFDAGAGAMSLRFFDAYATSQTVGEMMTTAQIDYRMTVPEDRFTLQEFILIGDPSLRMGGYP